jgi:hypothetical protein
MWGMRETREKPMVGAPFYGAFALTFLAGSAFLGVPSQLTFQIFGPQSSATVESIANTDLYGNPCDTMMETMKGMTVLGESMEAMNNHMCITPTRPELPKGEGRANAVFDKVRAAIEKYRDGKKAIADGHIAEFQSSSNYSPRRAVPVVLLQMRGYNRVTPLNPSQVLK